MNQRRRKLVAPQGRCATKALIGRTPERMIWPSNWPHPSAPDDADLLDLLLDWAPDERTRRQILADNPMELFGFIDAEQAA